MTTLYVPYMLDQSFALCADHALVPMKYAARVWGIELSGTETPHEVITLVEAARAARGLDHDLLDSFEGECVNCKAGVPGA